MKKRILLINKSLIVGGIETVLETQYNTLKQDSDVNILLYKRKNQSSISDNEIDYVDEYKNLATYIKEQEEQKKFDLIICHAQSEKICKQVKKLKHDRVLFVIHGMHSSQFDKGNFLAKYFRLFRKRRLYNNQNIVSVSDAVKQNFLNLSIVPKVIKTIYNPFDIALLQKLGNSEKESSSYTNQTDYIVWVGRISRVKNLSYLIDVYKNIAEKFCLKIVGIGDEGLVLELKDKIKKLGLEDRVFFEGYCKNPYPLIKNAKALLLTSKYEGLPTVVLESLILNTPVFSVNIAATREILTKFFMQGLIKTTDEKKFAKYLLENIDQKLDINKIHTELSYEKSNLKYLNFFNVE